MREELQKCAVLHWLVKELIDSILQETQHAAIGKGFAIRLACLISLVRFGASTTIVYLTVVNVLEPLQFIGLVVISIHPYVFTSMTIKAVRKAFRAIIVEIARQESKGLNREVIKPDYSKSIRILAQVSIVLFECLYLFHL